MVDGNPANHAMINATLCANPKFADRVIVKYALLGPPESVGEVCGITLAPNAGGNGNVMCGDQMKEARARGVAMDFMPLRTLQTVLDEVGVLDYQAFKMDVEHYGALLPRFHHATLHTFCSEFASEPGDTVRCRVQSVGRRSRYA